MAKSRRGLDMVVEMQIQLYRLYMFMTDPRTPRAIELTGDIAKAQAELRELLGLPNDPFDVLRDLTLGRADEDR